MHCILFFTSAIDTLIDIRAFYITQYTHMFFFTVAARWGVVRPFERPDSTYFRDDFLSPAELRTVESAASRPIEDKTADCGGGGGNPVENHHF